MAGRRRPYAKALLKTMEGVRWQAAPELERGRAPTSADGARAQAERMTEENLMLRVIQAGIANAKAGAGRGVWVRTVVWLAVWVWDLHAQGRRAVARPPVSS